MNPDAGRVIERLSVRVGALTAELDKRDVLIDQLERRIAELESGGKVTAIKQQQA